MSVLRRDYTAEDLDRGVEMTFHPTNGVHLHELQLSDETREFLYEAAEILWDHGYPPWYPLPRIGDGHVHAKGESYLLHWKFDPWTGASLLPTVRELPTAWFLD